MRSTISLSVLATLAVVFVSSSALPIDDTVLSPRGAFDLSPYTSKLPSGRKYEHTWKDATNPSQVKLYQRAKESHGKLAVPAELLPKPGSYMHYSESGTSSSVYDHEGKLYKLNQVRESRRPGGFKFNSKKFAVHHNSEVPIHG